eukprot:scaffold105602_cov30-Tisochrysis_lutea.AAC.3
MAKEGGRGARAMACWKMNDRLMTLWVRAPQYSSAHSGSPTRSFNAVGTQSAVLAGFAMTSFAEIDLPHNAFYAQKVALARQASPDYQF